jgi:small conductance mechanosensitive channel
MIDSLVTYFSSSDGLRQIFLIILGIIVWLIIRIIIQKSLKIAAHELEQHETTLDVGDKVRKSYKWYIDLFLTLIISLVILTFEFSIFGQNFDWIMDLFAPILRGLFTWVANQGFTLFFIIIFAWALIKLTNRSLPRLVRTIMFGNSTADEHEEIQKQAETLTTVFSGIIRVLIILGAIFMILSKLGVPIGPILGGFGIAGIAVGFGAQHMVRDLIAGVMIIAENQYRTGDIVNIVGVSGMVEDINLRRTVLRDWDGDVHVIPNGEITVATNRTKHWSRINLDVGVAYKENIDDVFNVLNEIGNELSNDPHYGLMILSPPRVLRLNSFDDSQITIKMMGECKPMNQWEITGELRRRIKNRFDKEGIEIPFPHTTIYWGEAQVPLYWDQKRIKELKDTKTSSDKKITPQGITPEMREQMLSEIALSNMQQNISRQFGESE